MSKGKDYRGQKRRDGDEGLPSPYEMRSPRFSRSSFSGSEHDLSGVSEMVAGQNGNLTAPANATPTDAVVKWFKSERGYGFVSLGDGAGDAFLHMAILPPGSQSPLPGSTLKVTVAQGPRGAQVSSVLAMDTSTATPEAQMQHMRGSSNSDPGGRRPRRDFSSGRLEESDSEEISGTVKWFNPEKGYGFVSTNDTGKDVFVHVSVLANAGLNNLQEGQPVMMRVITTGKGREAVSIQPMG